MPRATRAPGNRSFRRSPAPKRAAAKSRPRVGSSVLAVAHPERAEVLREGWFATLDPGTRYPAVALFHRGVLVHAGRVPVSPRFLELDRVERCRMIALAVAAHLSQLLEARGAALSDLIALAVEHPQVYSRARSKGDPNDLLLLACLNGAVAALLGVETISPLPGEWCLIPKRERDFDSGWDSPRGRVVRSRMTDAEAAACDGTHDGVDAAGIGLKILVRLEQRLAGTT